MRITVMTEGGRIYRRQVLGPVDTADLPKPAAEAIEAIVRSIDFFALPTEDLGEGRDLIAHTTTVEEKGQSHSVTTNTTSGAAHKARLTELDELLTASGAEFVDQGD